MFKLKKIELVGFKSFADRTRLEFGDGTAAVVGPNGCGKSNLSDAITWVLGEQSAKSLRGDRMADVIFNGTNQRPATSMAEASLTLIDPEYVEAGPPQSLSWESAPTPSPDDSGPSGMEDAENLPAKRGAERHRAMKQRAGEITVTRRLFRSGESEYLINGEPSRLRDIQDLFMGTGLGPESYAIIEQGRIGQILSSKPSDRRAIIEEAAGVSKFKARKRLAEAKLESSRQNLSRINDILQEVTKQINSLKRQAGKARRYREMHGELRKRLQVVITSRILAFDAECRRLRADLETAVAACAGASEQLELLEREERAIRTQQEELDGRLTGLRQSVAQRNVEGERLSLRIEQAEKQHLNLEARTQEAVTEAGDLAAETERIQREAAEQDAGAALVRAQWDEARAMTRQLQGREGDLAAQVSSGESDLDGCRRELLLLASKAAEFENQLVKTEEMGLALDRQLGRLASEKAAVADEHQHLSGELESFDVEHRIDQTALSRLSQAVAETAQTLDATRGEESRLRSELDQVRQEFATVTARKQALDESLARHAYTTETVRRLLAGPIPINGSYFRPLGVLADFVEVAPGYEEVVEDFLKDELDYVVVEHHEEARSGIALLRAEGSGRSTFFVRQVRENGHASPQGANGSHDSGNEPAAGTAYRHEAMAHQVVPAGGTSHGNGYGTHSAVMVVTEASTASGTALTPLRDLVQFAERLGLNGDMVLPAIEDTYLVEDGSTAERMAAAYPQAHFLTKEGERYHRRLVTGGRGQSSGPLALRRDFRDLDRRAETMQQHVSAAESGLRETSQRLAALDEERRRLAAAHLEAEKKSVLGSERLRQWREAAGRAALRHGALEKEAGALAGERQSARLRQSSLREQMELAAAMRMEREKEVARRSGEVHDLRRQLDQVKTDLIQAQGRSSTLEERSRSIETEQRRLRMRLEELRSRLTRLEQQCVAWREEQLHLGEEGKLAGARLAEIEREQERAREELAGFERDLEKVSARRRELFPLIDGSRARFESLRQKRSEVEVALARAESGLAHGAQQCREELKMEPESLLAAALGGTVAGDLREELPVGEALEAAERELEQLKARIEDLGPVNMMALEELQEAEERFTFLDTQRQDLLASVEDTTQAIREIDQVSRAQFLEAFQAINLHFAETFKILFGGGTGQMRLSDENDSGSGIEMVAQPPGKRLQNVLLLSGGEKALTALALLISMFRYTPSPFCILDEVDAPLDEANVERFTRLIQQMSKHTQFILITHNRRTMEIAKLLYGVTMQEPGVSKLVSVRFDEVAA